MQAWQPWKLQSWLVVLVTLNEIRNLFIPRNNGDRDSESDAVLRSLQVSGRGTCQMILVAQECAEEDNFYANTFTLGIVKISFLPTNNSKRRTSLL